MGSGVFVLGGEAQSSRCVFSKAPDRQQEGKKGEMSPP